MDIQSCQFKCLMNWDCKSINTNEDENNLCQLNNQTIESKDGKALSTLRSRWTYWSTDYNITLVGQVCRMKNPCLPNFWCKDTCECPGYECIRLYEDCKTAYASGLRGGRILLVNNTLSEQPMFEVFCNLHNDKFGGSILIQRRIVKSKMNFSRNWADYKTGFGDMKGSFWIGLDKLHTLAAPGRGAILIVSIKEVTGSNSIHANYSIFEVAGEADNYRLTIGGYQGEAGDSMSDLNGTSFSTYDQANHPGFQNCKKVVGGWWHKECRLNLNSGHPFMTWKDLIIYSRMMIKYRY
eukprot:Seg2307.6 transcript_id=Seg2307.6/GoldUCD/mRNA.D3Y31 product=Tenascin-R protein_id=Seg2307.6/GoldUCD/D3Y31